MNRIQHIQYPVGQGGLHLGIVDNVAYIYDCGSVCESRSISYVQNVVNTLNDKGIKNLYIFISHLHTDHVCALPELLRQLSKQIKIYLFLPYITPIEKLYLIASLGSVSQWLINFIVNPQSITKFLEVPELSVVYISDKEQQKQENDIDKTSIKSCAEITYTIAKKINVPDFVFVPFVYPNFTQHNTSLFKSKVQSLLATTSWPLKNSELQHIVDNDNKLRQLCKVYGLLTSSINYTSLCLYVGFETTFCKSEIFTWNCCCNHFEYQSEPGWLHTGDYNLKCGKRSKYGNHFVTHYCKYFDHVGVIQIPHHGSSDNINGCFIDNFKLQDAVFFITGEMCPVGKEQPKRITKVLQQINQPVLLVSELPCSGITQIVRNKI